MHWAVIPEPGLVRLDNNYLPKMLSHTLQGVPAGETRVTCTACAGTLLLEFGLLSRLTGDARYEAAARHAALQVYGAHLFIVSVSSSCCACHLVPARCGHDCACMLRLLRCDSPGRRDLANLCNVQCMAALLLQAAVL